MGTIGERVLTAAIRRLPRHRRELGEALLAELPTVPPGRRAAWLAGGLWFVAKETLMRPGAYGWCLLAAVAVLATVDRLGTSDDSGMISLLILLASGAALGYLAPRRAWLTTLVVGSTLAIAGMVANVLAPSAANLPDPHGIAGAATLFVLIVPAAATAFLGAGLHRLNRRR